MLWAEYPCTYHPSFLCLGNNKLFKLKGMGTHSKDATVPFFYTPPPPPPHPHPSLFFFFFQNALLWKKNICFRRANSFLLEWPLFRRDLMCQTGNRKLKLSVLYKMAKNLPSAYSSIIQFISCIWGANLFSFLNRPHFKSVQKGKQEVRKLSHHVPNWQKSTNMYRVPLTYLCYVNSSTATLWTGSFPI